MDRIASLLKSARELQRRIYASLPKGYRAAMVMLRLADSSAEAFGTYLYAVFLSQGVEQMPPILGKSPEEFLAAFPSKDPRAISKKLPSSYGRALGTQAQKMLLLMVKRMHVVDDVMMKWMADVVLPGKLDIRPGTDLRTAHNLVLHSLKNAALNFFKSERHTTGLPEDEGGVVLDIHDPHALQELERLYGGLHSPAVTNALKKVAPWAPGYIALALQGYTDDEILGFTRADAESGRAAESLLAESLGYPYVPRPGSSEPLNKGIWSKKDVGIKDRIYRAIVEQLRD